MLRFQSGPRLAVGSPRKPLRCFAAAAVATSATLCTTLLPLIAPFAVRAQAQAPQARQASDPRPDPLNAQASVAPLVHGSAFTQYRRLTDEPLGSWRDANDTVTRIGGWRVYAREAAQPASPTASMPAGNAGGPDMKPAEPAKAAPLPAGRDPHAGHKMN